MGGKLERRTFVKLGISAAAVAAAFPLTLYEIGTPGVPNETEDPEGIYPGWIEAHLNNLFVQEDRGHFNFLRESILNNEILFNTTKDTFSYVLENHRLNRSPKLGDLLISSIDFARTNMQKAPVAKEADHDLEAVHAAVFALAGVFYDSWWSNKELVAFGVSPLLVNNFWGEGGIALIAFPPLFAAEDTDMHRESDRKFAEKKQEPHFNGRDRIQHFANHLMIGFEYQYARKYALHTAIEMPRIVEQVISELGLNSPENAAEALSFDMGIVYEALTTLSWSQLPLLNKRDDITQGFADPMVGADIKANRLGALVASSLFRRLTNGKDIQPIIDELNDGRFTQYETDPDSFVA